MSNLKKPTNVKGVTEILLKRQRMSKSDLMTRLNVTRQGLDYKLKNDAFTEEEISTLAEFLSTDVSIFYSGSIDDALAASISPSTQSDALLAALDKIESGFSTIENSYKSLLQQKDEIIKNQNFMIKILMDKTGSSVNFLNPVTEAVVLPMYPLFNVA